MQFQKSFRLLLLLGALILSACGILSREAGEPTSQPAPAPITATTTIEVAVSTPTTAPSATATTSPSPTAVSTTPTDEAACTDAAAFVADITVPDDSQMLPSADFVKIWRVRNTGTCTWDDRYTLVHVDGPMMGALSSTFPFPATIGPGEIVDLSLSLVSPAADGRHRSDWGLVNPQGARFGVGPNDSTLWIRLLVVDTRPGGGSISGFAWQDQNFDNQVDDGEALPGVSITLASDPTCGTLLGTSTTDGRGRFSFSGLAAGSYCLFGTDGNVAVSQSGLVLDEDQVLEDVMVTWPPIWPEPASISGWVWQDFCATHTGSDGALVIDGNCVADEEGGYRADGMIQPDESYLAGVNVKLVAGSCVGDDLPLQRMTVTDNEGKYMFDGLQPGTYCIFVDAAEAGNAAVLGSGSWTFPDYTIGYHEITLIADEQATPLNFGWDYQEGED